MVSIRIGDAVRIRVAPDVDERLWDKHGVVSAMTAENRLVVELDDGADVTVNPDQVEIVRATDIPGTFRGTILEGSGP